MPELPLLPPAHLPGGDRRTRAAGIAYPGGASSAAATVDFAWRAWWPPPPTRRRSRRRTVSASLLDLISHRLPRRGLRHPGVCADLRSMTWRTPGGSGTDPPGAASGPSHRRTAPPRRAAHLRDRGAARRGRDGGALAEFGDTSCRRRLSVSRGGAPDHLVEAAPHLLSPYRPRFARGRGGISNRSRSTSDGDQGRGASRGRGVLAGGESLRPRTSSGQPVSAGAGQRRLGLPLGRTARMRRADAPGPAPPDVFAAGDVAIVEGASAPAAGRAERDPTGRHAAETVLRARRGDPLLPYRYADKGSLATIGRSRAIAVIGRIHSLPLAWGLAPRPLVMLIGFSQPSRLLITGLELRHVDFGSRRSSATRRRLAVPGPSPRPADPSSARQGAPRTLRGWI